MESSVSFLKSHLHNNIALLDRANEFFPGLSQDVVQSLRQSLQEELDSLDQFPEDATLSNIMDEHWRKAQERNKFK